MPPTVRDTLPPRQVLTAPPTPNAAQARRAGDGPPLVPWAPPPIPLPPPRSTLRQLLGRRASDVVRPPAPPPRAAPWVSSRGAPCPSARRQQALWATLTDVPAGTRRDEAARAAAAQLEAAAGRTDYARRVAALLERLLAGSVGEAFDALSADPNFQRRLAREAARYVGLELLVALPPRRFFAAGAARPAPSVAQRRADAAHALMMVYKLATPPVRRVLKPVRPNALVPREVASDLVYFARTVVAEVATGVPWALCVAHLCAAKGRIRPGLREALQAAAGRDLELERCALGYPPRPRALRAVPSLRRRGTDPSAAFCAGAPSANDGAGARSPTG